MSSPRHVPGFRPGAHPLAAVTGALLWGFFPFLVLIILTGWMIDALRWIAWRGFRFSDRLEVPMWASVLIGFGVGSLVLGAGLWLVGGL